MKRLFYIVVGALFVLSACKQKNVQDQQVLLDASKEELATALSERDELLSLMTDISSATDRIKQLENILSVVNGKENPSQRARILADIDAIKQTLKQRREKLAELEEKVKASGMYSEELQRSIKAMRSQLDNRSAEIDTLKMNLDSANVQIDQLITQVDSLNTTVETVNQELVETKDEALRLESELNICYYVVASKSELKEHKIIQTGFMRKTKLLKGDFDKNFFIISDKRVLNNIALNSNKAKLLSTHAEGSYEIVDGENGQVLNILSPEQFWDQSNYLVIQAD